MKRKTLALSRRYLAALHGHLENKQRSASKSAHAIGLEAVSGGLETLDLAKIHENALIQTLSGYRTDAKDAMFRRAGTFFAEAIMPMEKAHRIAQEAKADSRSTPRPEKAPPWR